MFNKKKHNHSKNSYEYCIHCDKWYLKNKLKLYEHGDTKDGHLHVMRYYLCPKAHKIIITNKIF